MKSLFKSPNNNLILKSVKKPSVSNNEVLIKVDLAGICRTDVYVADGSIEINKGLIIGHEFSGTVVESKSEKFKVGDYVACNPIFKDLNMIGVNSNGCFAEFISISSEQLYNANGINRKLAAYVEPIAASLAPLKSRTISKEGKGLLIGKNRISKLTLEIMLDAGYDCDIASIPDLKNIKESSYDYVIETLHSETIFDEIPRILKKQGTLILKSRNPEKTPINFYKFVKKEIILESLYYNDFDLAVKYAKEKDYLFLDLMGDTYPLEDWKKAFEADSSGNKKVFFKL